MEGLVISSHVKSVSSVSDPSLLKSYGFRKMFKLNELRRREVKLSHLNVMVSLDWVGEDSIKQMSLHNLQVFESEVCVENEERHAEDNAYPENDPVF